MQRECRYAPKTAVGCPQLCAVAALLLTVARRYALQLVSKAGSVSLRKAACRFMSQFVAAYRFLSLRGAAGGARRDARGPGEQCKNFRLSLSLHCAFKVRIRLLLVMVLERSTGKNSGAISNAKLATRYLGSGALAAVALSLVS